jgi:type I restriction enzyme S subunit
MAPAPGVVTGRYGTIGKVYFIETEFWPLNTALYVKDFKGHSPRFVFFTLQGLDFQQFSDNGAVPGVNRNDLHRAPIVLPSDDIQDAFEEALSPLCARMAANDHECATLAQMRDLLLPKLMSGEIRVRDAEEAIAVFS